MASELQLLQEEEIGGLASVIASILLVESSLKGQENTIAEQNNIPPASTTAFTDQLDLDSSLLFLLSAYIYAYTTYTRYSQRKDSTPEGEGPGYYKPEELIFIGSLIILIGYVVLTQGTNLALDRDQQVII